MAASSSWSLPDGDSVEVTPVTGGFTAQLHDPEGNPTRFEFSAIQPQMGLYTFESLTPLATGGYALDYIYGGALLPGVFIESATFTAGGQLLGQAQVSAPSNENGGFPLTYGQIYALPDGGFVEAWADGAPYSGNAGNEVVIREFDIQGQPVENAQLLGVLASGQIGVQVQSDGGYVVSWQGPSGPQQQTFTEQSPALSSNGPAPGETLIAQTPVTLTGSAGWTSAAVLADHALAIVGAQDGGYGSHLGVEQTYDASGAVSASASLMGYAGPGQTLTPEIVSLGQGGLYEVSYAGSNNYEVYDNADQLVFAHNAYTNPNAQLTALTGGGYVVTDFPDQAMALYDSQGNNIGWFNLTGSAPTSILARGDGGFDFVYADHVLGYDAQGQQDLSVALGAQMSNFATASVATGGDGVLSVWLSPDDGQNGLATSIRVQGLAPGAAGNGAVEVAQDLDPWHTVFQLQAHADGSAAILWSEGGGIFGAEYAGGAVGPAYAAVAGDLLTTDAIQLPGDKVGLAYIQNGDIWAEIFDPSTGAVQRADLGITTGDISGVHALATASGGIAVSWHGTGSGVSGAVLSASGQASAVSNLPGDFLGVDAAGHAVTLHDVGGTPVMQTYALNDGLFWTA